jgi:hypothetical protein
VALAHALLLHRGICQALVAGEAARRLCRVAGCGRAAVTTQPIEAGADLSRESGVDLWRRQGIAQHPRPVAVVRSRRVGRFGADERAYTAGIDLEPRAQRPDNAFCTSGPRAQGM